MWGSRLLPLAEPWEVVLYILGEVAQGRTKNPGVPLQGQLSDPEDIRCPSSLDPSCPSTPSPPQRSQVGEGPHCCSFCGLLQPPAAPYAGAGPTTPVSFSRRHPACSWKHPAFQTGLREGASLEGETLPNSAPAGPLENLGWEPEGVFRCPRAQAWLWGAVVKEMVIDNYCYPCGKRRV